MPSARVVCVALLAGLGAVTGALGGTGTDDVSTPDLRGSQVSASPTPSATATPAPPSTAFDVRAENRRPGTDAWRVPAAREAASGLAVGSLVDSVDAGAKVPLMISAAGSVTVRVLRIGWYAGAGSRTVWQGDLQTATAGSNRSLDSGGWPPGHYLLRFDHADAARTVPLTVRSPQARGDVVLLASTLTWQLGNAAGFVRGETGLVQQAERDGRRLAYATDLDVSENPSWLTGAAAIVTGDSRVWTPQLRAAVRSAAAAGTNVAFFAAGTGGRTITDPGDAAPGTGRAALAVLAAGGFRATAAERTAMSRLSGLRPDCGRAATPASAWTVSEPGWWGYRGTGAYAGQQVPGLVDDGTDTAASGSTAQVVADSSFSCAGRSTTQAAGYRVLPSGAALFAAGTTGWACSLNRTCAVPAESRAFAVRVTRNVLTGLARPEAGRRFAGN